MFKTENFQNGIILTKMRGKKHEIGILSKNVASEFSNQSVFKQITLENNIVVLNKKEKINLKDFDFFRIQEKIILRNNKNIFNWTFKYTFLLNGINDGIAYYYCLRKNIYVVKDIRNNIFLRKENQKFFYTIDDIVDTIPKYKKLF
jgi:hypothetical protein